MSYFKQSSPNPYHVPKKRRRNDLKGTPIDTLQNISYKQHQRRLSFTSFFCCFSLPWYRAVQQLRATLHQLHQRKASTILQSPHVHSRTRRIHARRNRVDIHWLWHGSSTNDWSDREGIVTSSHETAGTKHRRTGKIFAGTHISNQIEKHRQHENVISCFHSLLDGN